MHRKQPRAWIAAAAVAATILAAACDDAFGPRADAGIAVSFTAAAGGAASISPAVGPLFSVSAAAERALEIQQVDLVLARVHLGRERRSEKCEEGGAECAPVKLGPVLVSLPLSGGSVSPFTALPPPGTYDRIQFQVHRPEGSDAATRAFFTANAGWPENASVRVKGTFDAGDGQGAQPFDVFLRASGRVRQRIDPPLVIGDGTALDALGVTVTVDVNQWFRGRDGSTIDPRALAADRELLAVVERNIRESFRALSHRKDGRGERGRDKRDR